MTRKQTIARALKSGRIQRALSGLVGCPEGGWAATDQAYRQLIDALPARSARHYAARELVSAALTLDHADRYQWRDDA